MSRTKQTESKSPEVISWKGLRGNPFMMSLHPMMLEPSGYLATRKVKIEREDNSFARELRVIKYDREFVIRRIKMLLNPLLINESSIKDLHSLVDEALKIGDLEKYDTEQV